MKLSDYRAPDYSLVHAHDLTLVGHLVSYISGAAVLPNGGAVVAATTMGNKPTTPSMDLALRRTQEKAAGVEGEKPSPWVEWDGRVLESLKRADVLALKGLSRAEARGLMEYWAASGVLRQKVDEKVVAEKWVLSGNGVVGEIERGALRMHIVS